MEKLKYSRFLLVKDNFYSNPNKVYQTALNAKYFEPENATGYRSTEVYHEVGIKTKLETILGIKINRWDKDPREENGVFYHGLSSGKKREIPGVHADYPLNDITVVIYLTPDLPFNCGTSLWMHKQTGLMNPATATDVRRLKRSAIDLHEMFESETKDRSKWLEIDRIGYRFNRMIAYPSGVFHSATNHYGNNLHHGRIYQTLRIGVDWSTFKMNKV